MNSIKLSDKYTIYIDRYNNDYHIDEFLKYTELNDKLAFDNSSNSVNIEIHTPCFNSVNNQIKKLIEETENVKFVNYSEHYWVYTQTKGFNMEWMHQHIQVHPPGRSKILSDYTFTFYLQTTNEISGDEGCIVFEDENKKRHKFLPEVGDIFIFPSDLKHTAMPTPNSEKKRIVYAGCFCIDVWNQKKIEKNII
jgi:predicted 2-oxoglutarate/Fe(II)-dependent dioxygenase YbiX